MVVNKKAPRGAFLMLGKTHLDQSITHNQRLHDLALCPL